MSWVETRVGDLVKIVHGFAFRGEFFTDAPTEHLLLTPGHFAVGGGFQFKSGREQYYRGPVPNDYVLSAGDLVVTMTDLSRESDILGFPALVPEVSGVACLHNQRLGKAVAKPGRMFDKRFLYYALCTEDYRAEVLASSTGTGVKHTAPSRIESYKFMLPPLDEQRAIAEVLGALDDKIELNRQMNHTLEEMASALFKSWFIDFDPVIAKVDGRKPFGMDATTASLFTAAYADSELGPIPRGWRVTTVSACVADIFDGPHATPPDATSGGVFLGIGNMTGTGLDLSDVRHIAEADWERWTKRVTPCEGDIVFTYEAALGRFALIPAGLRCCLGRRMALVRPLAPNHTPFLFHQFIAGPFQDVISARAWTGSTVDRTPLTEFPDYPFLWPGEALVTAFSQQTAPMWGLIHHNQAESRTLTALRDTLLPKLLSGEVRLKQAEKLVEAAL